MANSRTSSLLIDRGDLPSLAAALLQVNPANLILWHVRRRDGAASRREAMVLRHAELFGARDVVVVEPWEAGDADPREEPALREAMELIQAAIAARRAGCARIVWPAQFGHAPDLVPDVVDRATALADLVALCPPGGPSGSRVRSDMAFDLPIVDLDDDQIVDIVDDAGAPADHFWPCDLGVEHPCGACGGCERWKAAFAIRGIPGPWDAVPVAGR